MGRLLSAVCAVIVLVAGSASGGSTRTAASGWNVRDLGTLGGSWSRAVDLNDQGEVVGWSRPRDAGSLYKPTHPFVWSNGSMIDIGASWDKDTGGRAIAVNGVGTALVSSQDLWHDPPWPHSFVWQGGRGRAVGPSSGWGTVATALDDRGEVVGASIEGSWEEMKAFLWRSGTSLRLGTVAGRQYTVANEITNVDGRTTIVGSAYDLPIYASFNHARSRAFIWRNGAMKDLGLLPGTNECQATDVSERGWVIGTCDVGHRVSTDGMPDWRTSDPIGFVWRTGRMRRLPGVPTAIAKDGSVVGTRGRSAFLWRNGVTTTLPPLIPNRSSSARAINARGQIMGASAGHTVVWESRRIHDLGPGDPNAINDRGWIVGARNGRAVLWTPIGS